MKAELYIDGLKHSVDAFWENYGDKEALEPLIYGDHGYGILQRVELAEITDIINDLKTKTDALAADCSFISSQERKLCLLAVDDNIDFLNIVGLFLKKNGVEVDLASSGAEGIKMLSENPEKYTMVLLDIQMEGMDGFGVLQWIRENENAAISAKPVVAMSGKAKSLDCAGFDYFLPKPFDLDEFIPTIRNVISAAANK